MAKRLPADLAWPATATQIQSALGALAAEVSLSWDSYEPSLQGRVFHATWEPRVSGMVGGPIGRGAALSINPVKRDDLAQVSDGALPLALTEVAAWLRDAVHASEVWQLTAHARWWVTDDGTLKTRDRW